MRLCSLLVLFFACPAVFGQNIRKPLTHIDVCKQFSQSVVRIDVANGRGTGFVVSPDGWILTAAHVVVDRNTGQYYRAISVTMPHKWEELGTPVLAITEAVAHDFALLKIDRTGLPFVELGDESAVEIGSDISIVGFPFSALDEKGEYLNVRFCLTGTAAANTSFSIGKSQVNVIYFQGVSVKGISGSPIISDKTGQVVGVVSTKLTGIGRELQQLTDDIAQGKGRNIIINGYEPGTETLKIINVLDLQLANGLGMGVGAADAAYALKKAQRDYKQPER
jgi:S1-C subfamily serine protease